AAPLAVALRDALVHRVERAMVYFIPRSQSVDSAKATLDRGLGDRLLVLFILAYGKHGAPHAWNAKQEEPLLRIGEVGDVGEPRQSGGEGGGGAGDEEPLRPGEACQLDAERFAHAAAAAVRSDEPARLDLPCPVDRYG